MFKFDWNNLISEQKSLPLASANGILVEKQAALAEIA
jgi:hypothetical protein